MEYLRSLRPDKLISLLLFCEQRAPDLPMYPANIEEYLAEVKGDPPPRSIKADSPASPHPHPVVQRLPALLPLWAESPKIKLFGDSDSDDKDFSSERAGRRHSSTPRIVPKDASDPGLWEDDGDNPGITHIVDNVVIHPRARYSTGTATVSGEGQEPEIGAESRYGALLEREQENE
ncbi:hypothetical protein ABW21_db0204657 [Orbilia brochopaga]|nr:hypothetical protein ABW21_db0204657 [Drechslerella brochopaga]